MNYQIAAVTDTGNVRLVNQDAYLIRQGDLNGAPAVFLAVSDGMGGLRDGEIASQITISALRQWWEERTQGGVKDWTELGETLNRSIYQAHREIYLHSQQVGQRVGTTLSALLIAEGFYLYKQIGDSRIYTWQNDGWQQITVDQTWCNEQVASGKMTVEEAAAHKYRHVLSNALGASEELSIAEGFGKVAAGMSFLLCSDGFYGTPHLIERGDWGFRHTPQQCLNTMLDEILRGRAEDNCTAVLCWCR